MDAMQAWRALPAREYQSEPRARVSAPRRRRAAQRDATATGVQILAGPVDLQRDLLSGDETPAVRLTVASAAGEVRLDVGPRALRTGVLLGRYERCDSGGLQVLSHPDISRVHLFVTEVDGAVCALDVASTNGLWLGRTEVRLHEVASRDRLQLGHDLASVTVEIIA